jgi:hypothetical protein
VVSEFRWMALISLTTRPSRSCLVRAPFPEIPLPNGSPGAPSFAFFAKGGIHQRFTGKRLRRDLLIPPFAKNAKDGAPGDLLPVDCLLVYLYRSTVYWSTFTGRLFTGLPLPVDCLLVYFYRSTVTRPTLYTVCRGTGGE